MIADQCQVSLRDTVGLADLPASSLAGYLQSSLRDLKISSTFPSAEALGYYQTPLPGRAISDARGSGNFAARLFQRSENAFCQIVV
jgi:hypothetical protein